MMKTTSFDSTSRAVLAVVGSFGLALTTQTALGQAQDAALQKEPGWEKSAAIGMTLTRGNSDTVMVNGNVLATKKTGHHEFNLGADATYGETEETKTAESLHGFGQYNRLLGERAFGYLRLDALHDAVADLEYRLTLSPGVGYYFIKKENTSLRAEVGPAFIYEKQGNETKGYMSLRIAERFEHKFNERVRVWQSVEFLPQVDRFENWIMNAELGVEAGLTKKLSLRTFLQDTYDNEPAPGRKKNDLKLVTALAYKF